MYSSWPGAIEKVTSLSTGVEPLAATTIEEGGTLSLQADAFDWETPDLPDTAFAWASDIDGPLGDGPWLTTQSLSAGEHLLTLTVTDDAGLSTSASVQVLVTPGVASLPVSSPEALPAASPAASPACDCAAPSTAVPEETATDP